MLLYVILCQLHHNWAVDIHGIEKSLFNVIYNTHLIINELL